VFLWYFVEDILTVFFKTVSRKSSMKTRKETKSFLHFWLRVWMLQEEMFISYVHTRLMLEGSNIWLPPRSPPG